MEICATSREMMSRGLNKPTTFVRPDLSKHKRRLLWVAFGMMLFAVVLGPATTVLMAQSSASAPVFNATVQGQSASTVEGTFANVVNYIGNVICPIGSALMVAATVVQVKAGRSWVPVRPRSRPQADCENAHPRPAR